MRIRLHLVRAIQSRELGPQMISVVLTPVAFYILWVLGKWAMAPIEKV